MHISSLLVALALPVGLLAAPSPQSGSSAVKCTNPQVRKEWRELTTAEKDSYIQANLCLHKKPALLEKIYAGTTSRYEDFTTCHKNRTPYSHMNGLFLAWHRLYIREWEYALQSECGYIGAQPYWDYTIDAYEGGNFTKSPIFDPVHGFGGNGAYDPNAAPRSENMWGGGIVKDGPFKDWIFHVSPGSIQSRYVTRPLKRNLYEKYSTWVYQDKEDRAMQQTNFWDMNKWMEGLIEQRWDAIHGGGHFIVGGYPGSDGTGADVWTSPLEPLFWLHHTNLDRIWWDWQQKQPDYKFQIGGSMVPRYANVFGRDSDFNFEPGPVSFRTPVSLGDLPATYNNATLGQLLSTIGEKTPDGNHESFLCYVYQKSPKPKRN